MTYASPPRLALGERLRLVTSLVAIVLVCLAATGTIAAKAFTDPTPLKYGVTVAAPLVLLLVARAPRPAEIAVPLAIVAAPFSSLVVGAAGAHVSVFAATLVLAVVCVVFDPQAQRGVSRTGRAGVVALGLIVPAVLLGRGQLAELELFSSVGLLAWLTAGAAQRTRGLWTVVAGVALSAAGQGGLAIYEFVTKSSINFYGQQNASISTDYFFNFAGTDRAIGSFSDPISLGNVLAVVLPVIVVSAVVSSMAKNRVAAFVLAVAAVLDVVGLGVTLSRTSWIAAVVGVVLAGALGGRVVRRRVALALIGGLAVAVIVVPIVVGPAIITRFSSIFDPTSSTVSTAAGDRTRESLWHVAENVFVHHAIFGVGVGNLNVIFQQRLADVTVYTHAHETFLQIAAEAGLLGLLALVALVVGVSRDMVSSSMPREWRAMLIGALAALTICWTTDYTIRYLPVAASIAPVFGMIAGLASKRGLRTDDATSVPSVSNRDLSPANMPRQGYGQ